MINIISTFYISKYGSSNDNKRTDELIQALINNINSEIIEKIHLFIDDDDSLEKLNEIKSKSNNSDKIVIIAIKKQPIYHDFFNYILEKLPNNICMIINSDIYLHSYDKNLINLLSFNKYLYALTRYEYDMSHSLINNYCGSHDCYIFNSKYLDYKIICENTNFKQNLLGIETRIIKSFCDLNYKVFNPCKQIKIVHLHNTNLRSYNENYWIGLHKYGDNLFMMKNCWYVPPSILLINDKDGIIYIFKISKISNLNIILKNKKYSWGDSYITFLDNYKMDAFGEGYYKIIDFHNITAIFGNRSHNIKFNDDYTEYISTRKDDSNIINGKLLIENNLINKVYTWGNSNISFLDNYKMDAFGEGNYKIMDKNNIIANFGGKDHEIKFNDDYTEFISTRTDDLCIANGKLIFENNLVNKIYTWGNSYITFLDNYKMDAFGKGNYKIIDKYNIIANFGSIDHNIKFNEDYTEFISIRKDNLSIVTGNLFYLLKY